jgi:hypothetical protein
MLATHRLLSYRIDMSRKDVSRTYSCCTDVGPAHSEVTQSASIFVKRNTSFSHIEKIQLSRIMMRKGAVKQTDHSKFLGIFLDKHLTFSELTSFVCKEPSNSIAVIHEVNNILPTDAVKILQHKLIRSFLLHGVEVLHMTDKSQTN